MDSLRQRLRLPLRSDKERIRAALDAALYRSLASEAHGKSTVDLFCDDRNYTVEMIVQNMVDAVVIKESYLLVYAIVKPWYSLSRYALTELLVLKIGKGGSFKDVTDTLDLLSEDNDCESIAVGGALTRSPAALQRLYRRAGYKMEPGMPQLTKRRITDG